MEFMLAGLDSYVSQVDDRGIDLVARTDDGRHYDVQVKSSRELNYIFLKKRLFQPRDRLLAAVVRSYTVTWSG